MSDYNSQYSGARIEELLAMIPNLAKADLSNAMTVSLGANGYAKFNNGLLIQWGTRVGATGGAINLYFPTSFYNTDYNIYFTGAVIIQVNLLYMLRGMTLMVNIHHIVEFSPVE